MPTDPAPDPADGQVSGPASAPPSAGPGDGPLLMLMRHAKASSAEGPDRRRPLADRGRRDAPLVGGWLAENDLLPDVVLSSDAARARETSELVVAGSGAEIAVQPVPDLYGATVAEVLEVVAETSDEVRRLLVVGHEPTSSETLAVLTGSSPVFPTAAVAVVRLAGTWRDVAEQGGTLVAFRTPKG